MVALADAVRALLMASPWAVTARFPGEPYHCIPATNAGVEALQAFGITARAVRCYALGAYKDATTGKMELTSTTGMGQTAEEQYQSLLASGLFKKPITFEEFTTKGGVGDKPHDSLHCIIEASQGAVEAMIDLTSSQISNANITLPNNINWFVPPAPKWPSFTVTDHAGTEVGLTYRPGLKSTIPDYVGADYHIIAADLIDLMNAFMADPNGFEARMRRERYPERPSTRGPDDSLWR